MKIKSLMLLSALFLILAPMVYAQGDQRGQMMQMPMMGAMMEKGSMVSSGDGGVIVMIGKTLYKYDKNLNLVKQIDLPIETPQEKMMEKMADKNSMMQKKGCSCGMGGSCGGQVSSGQTSSQAQPQAASGHESHH